MEFRDLIFHPNQFRNKIRDTLRPPKFSFNIIFLFLNNLTWGFASGMIWLFLPIFLFEKFNYSISKVIIFYLIAAVLYGVLVPVGARIMTKIGLKKSLILAMPCLAFYYLSLYFFETLGIILFIALALLMLTLFRTLYWTPYHVEFAEYGDSKERGAQIAYLSSLGLIAGVLAPFLAGFIIEQLGFPVLFIMAIILVFLSILPLYFLTPVKEEYSFSYLQTFKELFSKKNWRIFVGYGSDGAQGIVAIVIWPIFIFGILNESYVTVGGISAAIILAGILLRIIMGRLAEVRRQRKLFKLGSVFYSLGWILKMYVQTSFQIFIIGTYHSFAGVLRGIPLTAFLYEQMVDRGHYIDEYTVLREVSINVGQVLMLIACLILLNFVGFTWTFVLAAIASLLVRVL